MARFAKNVPPTSQAPFFSSCRLMVMNSKAKTRTQLFLSVQLQQVNIDSENKQLSFFSIPKKKKHSKLTPITNLINNEQEFTERKDEVYKPLK